MSVLLALLTILAVFSDQASASSLHLCPVPNFVSGTMTTAGDDPWTVILPKGEAEMFVSGDTIYCKIGGLLLTKAAPNKNCVATAVLEADILRRMLANKIPESSTNCDGRVDPG